MEGSGESVRVVLVRPKDSRNVGAVCRAIKNMGITSLSIVMDDLIDPKKAEVLAIHASDVLERAEVYWKLEDAIRGASLVAGVTRRRGKWRKYFSVTPAELAERAMQIKEGWVALVFGDEVSGLTDRDLSLCNISVRIPSSPDFPSLNLSHAVQIVVYEILKARDKRYTRLYKPITWKRLNGLTGVMVKSLRAIGFFKQVTGEDMRVFFRDILGRAMLSEGEAKRIEKIFKKIEGLYRVK